MGVCVCLIKQDACNKITDYQMRQTIGEFTVVGARPKGITVGITSSADMWTTIQQTDR